MNPITKRRAQITDKISEAASNIGALTAAALLIACVALIMSAVCFVSVRKISHAG